MGFLLFCLDGLEVLLLYVAVRYMSVWPETHSYFASGKQGSESHSHIATCMEIDRTYRNTQ